MKPASNPFKTFLATNTQFVCVDLFDVTLFTGTTLYFSAADIDVVYNSNTYVANSLQITGLRYRINLGLEADEQSITIGCDRSMTYNGEAWIDQIRGGILDGAQLKRTRVYYDTWGGTEQGAIVLFTGYVSTVQQITRVGAQCTVKSYISLLDVEMPRRKYQAGCLNTLYDARCGVNKVANGTNGTVGVGSTIDIVVWSGSTVDTYNLGTITFLTGANAGLTRAVKYSFAGNVQLTNPLPIAPSSGDTFTIYLGCDKRLSTCGTKFSNSANFAGFPFIPAAEKAY